MVGESVYMLCKQGTPIAKGGHISKTRFLRCMGPAQKGGQVYKFAKCLYYIYLGVMSVGIFFVVYGKLIDWGIL